MRPKQGQTAVVRRTYRTVILTVPLIISSTVLYDVAVAAAARHEKSKIINKKLEVAPR